MKNIIKGILLLGCCSQISYADGESDIEQQGEQQTPPTQQHQLQEPEPHDTPLLNNQGQQFEFSVVEWPSNSNPTQRTQTQNNGQEEPETLPQQQQSLPSSPQQAQTGSWRLLDPWTWFGSSDQPPQSQQQQRLPETQQTQTQPWSLFYPSTWFGENQPAQIQQQESQPLLRQESPEIVETNDGETETNVRIISEQPSRDPEQPENGDVNQENEMPEQQVQQEQPKDEEDKRESPSRHRRQQATLIEPEEEQQPDATDQAQVQQRLALEPPSMIIPILPAQHHQPPFRMFSPITLLLIRYNPFNQQPHQQGQEQLNQGQQGGLLCFPMFFSNFRKN